MSARTRILSSFWISLFLGAIGLANIVGRPRFSSFRAVDVLQLLGSGACFGVALSAIVVLIRSTRAS